MNNVPVPSPDALAHSQRLQQAIIDDVNAAGGWISFARFMEQVLDRPGLGYYTAGARKFGAAGDFVTAPEMRYRLKIAPKVFVDNGPRTGRCRFCLRGHSTTRGTSAPPPKSAIVRALW